MRAMKDSGVEWIGEIPAEWEVSRIKQLFSEVNERCDDSSQYTLLSVSEYYGVEPKSQKISADDMLTHAESLDGYKICQSNDIVMNIMLAWKKALGFSKYDGIVSPAYCVYRAKIDMDVRYFHYLFRTQRYADVFKQYSTGIIDSRLRLYSDKFFSLKCQVPPVCVQKRIADYLDEKCSKIDAVIEKQQAVIEKLKAYKLSAITEAVTKGVNLDVEMKDSGIEWLGAIPAHWEFIRMKNCCDIVDCKNRTPELIPEGEYTVIRTTCIRDGKFSYEGSYQTDKENYKAWIEKGKPQYGDVFFTREAPMGEACLVPKADNICMGQRVMYFRPNKVTDSRFILYSIYGSVIREYIESKNKGSTVGHLKLGQVANLPVLYCPYEEQKQITDFLDNKCSSIENVITKKKAIIDKLTDYKKSLIYEIVTGKKEV